MSDSGFNLQAHSHFDFLWFLELDLYRKKWFVEQSRAILKSLSPLKWLLHCSWTCPYLCHQLGRGTCLCMTRLFQLQKLHWDTALWWTFPILGFLFRTALSFCNSTQTGWREDRLEVEESVSLSNRTKSQHSEVPLSFWWDLNLCLSTAMRNCQSSLRSLDKYYRRLLK